jgi:putative peptide zinc metalloprotease protein
MIFELGLASLAAFAWVATLSTPDSLTHQIAYNAMVTASISTILFNANPLMRFDGYYMLSDLIEVPNLMGRSMNMLKYLMQKHVYRLETARSPGGSRAELTILVIYGIAALAYRIFLFFSITLFVMGRLFAIGLVLAIWTASAWFLIPVGKFVHWLASSPQLGEHRSRALAISAALVAGGVVLLGMIPFPDHRLAWGVVESEQRSGVYFGVAGFVVEAPARSGDTVEEGDPILICENPDLMSRIRQIRARIEELRATERSAMDRSDIAADVTREHIAKTVEELAFFEELADKLIVRAPHDGVIVGQDPASLLGSFSRRGDLVCAVVNMEDVRVVAPLSTAQAAPLKELEGGRPDAPDQSARFSAEIRSVANVSEVVGISGVRILEAGMRELPHGGLAQGAGGDIAMDPTDQQGRLARAPQFYAYLTSDEVVGMPGERVRVRFTLPDKPLLTQWVDRLRRLVQGRIDV